MEDELVKAREAMESALFPSGDRLKRIYAHYCKTMSYWKVEEAAALLMGMHPISDFDLADLNPELAEQFDLLVDMIGRQFGDQPVIPSELREWAPSTGIENELLWSAIDYYAAKKKKGGKGPRQSDETRKQKADGLILAAMASIVGFKDRQNSATTKIHDELLRWGVTVDHDTIRKRLIEIWAKCPKKTTDDSAATASNKVEKV
jgi:hypothetical protein